MIRRVQRTAKNRNVSEAQEYVTAAKQALGEVNVINLAHRTVKIRLAINLTANAFCVLWVSLAMFAMRLVIIDAKNKFATK